MLLFLFTICNLFFSSFPPPLPPLLQAPVLLTGKMLPQLHGDGPLARQVCNGCGGGVGGCFSLLTYLHSLLPAFKKNSKAV